MSRLRHPIRSLKEPFGKAGLTVAILALVLAMVGGAYAAGGLTKAQEKQVTKIAKKYAGKPGATGPAGTPGANGTNGTNGAAGKTGKEGPAGAEGSPWTAGGTLPEGQTEAGTWSVTPINFTQSPTHRRGFGAISFGIPLAAPPTLVYVKQGQEGIEHTVECPGSLAEPRAKKGFLCLYTKLEFETEFNRNQESETSTAGALLEVSQEENSPLEGYPTLGTWAVTAG